jgi:hypothetical protein
MGNSGGDIDGFCDDLLVTYVIDEEQKESRAGHPAPMSTTASLPAIVVIFWW